MQTTLKCKPNVHRGISQMYNGKSTNVWMTLDGSRIIAIFSLTRGKQKQLFFVPLFFSNVSHRYSWVTHITIADCSWYRRFTRQPTSIERLPCCLVKSMSYCKTLVHPIVTSLLNYWNAVTPDSLLRSEARVVLLIRRVDLFRCIDTLSCFSPC